MQKQSSQHLLLNYRPYNLPVHFPVIAFLGDNWIVSTQEPLFLHFHNCIEIGYCVSGSGCIYLNDLVLPFSKGDFSIIYANAPHISVSNQRVSKWEYLYFDPQMLLKSVAGNYDSLRKSFFIWKKSPGVIKPQAYPLLCELLRYIFIEFHQKKTLYQDTVNGMLLSAIALIDRIFSGAQELPCLSHPQYAVQEAIFYINEHYSENISISELASLFMMSESHLRRVFKTITGYSPLEYIQHFRIRQACHYIYLNQESLNNIARLVGYSSLSSFNRQFLQCMHMSPSAWKKSYLSTAVQNEVTSYNDSNTSQIFQL